MSSYREDESGPQIWDYGLRDYRPMSEAEKEKYRIHKLAALQNPKQDVLSTARRIVTIDAAELQILMEKAEKYDELMRKR